MAKNKNKLQSAYISQTNGINSFGGVSNNPLQPIKTPIPTATVSNTPKVNSGIAQVDGATVGNGVVNAGKTDLLGSAYKAPTNVPITTANPSKVITPNVSGNKGNETTGQTTSNETKAPLQISDLDEYKNLVNQKTSALSSLNQANQLAMKYADNTALAQGYATQGAALQNTANLQSAYLNQAGAINQNYQQQLGNLTNTKSAQTLENVYQTIQNEVANGTLTEEEGTKLLEQYGGLMNAQDMQTAQTYLNQGLKGQQISAEQNKQAQMESLTNAVIQNYGEISPENAQVLKDFESGKITATEAINQIYSSQNAGGGTAEPETNPLTGNTKFTSPSNVKYETNVSSVSGAKGSDFDINIGARTYEVQLGGEVSDISLNPDNYEVGQIYLYEDTKGLLSSNKLKYLVTKDASGKIRVVTDRAFGKGYKEGIGGKQAELYNIAKNLGLIKE